LKKGGEKCHYTRREGERVGKPPFWGQKEWENCHLAWQRARNRKMARSNSLTAFDSDQENWDTYIDRFDIYCQENDIDESKKAITLLNTMGAKTFGLLKSLAAPRKPLQLNFKEAVILPKEPLNPAPLVIAERFRFHRRDQQRGETVVEYLLVLCQYGEMRTDF